VIKLKNTVLNNAVYITLIHCNHAEKREQPIYSCLNASFPTMEPGRYTADMLRGFEAIIGLEVHLQLSTRSKMFSSVSADYFGNPPNSCTDPFTLGLPGVLPVTNKTAVNHALMFGLALNCNVTGFTQFHRKNYFYPDSPHNYQISQYDAPIARDGWIDVLGQRIGIKRAHLENDAGKNLHPDGAEYSLLDLNRAGCALIEMVTEPDIKDAEHARAFLEKIQAIVRALGIGDANPEEGKMRCDVNVSVRRPGEPFGTKVEIKNLNSFRSVARSLDYEIERQIKLIESGGKVTQDTVGWDEAKGKTFVMRTKEGEADYRYFPDPDLPPLEITPEWVAEVRARMPRLPDQKRTDYLARGVREQDAELIALSVPLSTFFEAVLETYTGDAQTIANWLNADVTGALNARDLEIHQSKLEPAHLARLIALIDDGTISGKIAKELLPDLMDGADPARLVEERGLWQVTDTSAIETAIQKVLAEKPDVVAQVAINPKAVNALFGPIMKETGGKAKPELVRALLMKALGLE
jgi:aspartyl-tRNA(Asn)/glutamyl-tRNA(Gln) amidotransferase subunit B